MRKTFRERLESRLKIPLLATAVTAVLWYSGNQNFESKAGRNEREQMSQYNMVGESYNQLINQSYEIGK